MKRNRMNRLNILVLTTLCVTLLAGCGTATEDTPAVSEAISEVVSEVASGEESSEPTTESVPEESTEGTTEEIDLTLYTEENGKNMVDLTNDMTYNELKLIVWEYEYGAKAIVSDGDSYVMENDDDLLFLYYPKKVQSIKDNMDGAIHILVEEEKYCGFNLYAIGKDLEITFTVTYEDGTEEDITIFLTKNFEH
ncbi:MAG: hypothetical protein IJ291_03290 [Lachnospiraceae bacterium]|nr:hypothetical protein [Lachnospiraceae bacterium]